MILKRRIEMIKLEQEIRSLERQIELNKADPNPDPSLISTGQNILTNSSTGLKIDENFIPEKLSKKRKLGDGDEK